MAFILNIDTAVQSASVCISQDAACLALAQHPGPRDSAAWLHTAIEGLLQQQGLTLQQLSAIAVSAGPGSYTGLRVGMAAAKGLCYAIQKPLITIPTLQMMAAALQHVSTDYICPMIDARRMEVFTAVYDKALNEVMPAQALVLQPNSFVELLTTHTVTFLGNGSAKFKELMGPQHNALFADVAHSAAHMAPLSDAKLISNNFTDLAYAEPAYGKEFFSTAHNK